MAVLHFCRGNGTLFFLYSVRQHFQTGEKLIKKLLHRGKLKLKTCNLFYISYTSLEFSIIKRFGKIDELDPEN